MNEIMEFMHELKELVHKGEQIAQQMQGGNFGQRKYGNYGMRDNQSYSGDYGGGNFGQRWGEPHMQGQYPMQGQFPQMQGEHSQQWPNVNPMMFM